MENAPGSSGVKTAATFNFGMLNSKLPDLDLYHYQRRLQAYPNEEEGFKRED
jgi:hypothetical protein